MKFRKNLIRILCFVLIATTLLLCCACAETEENSESDSYLGSGSGVGSDSINSSINGNNSNGGYVGSDKEIVLSNSADVRIVYSSDYRTQALKIQDKLTALDKSYSVGSQKYAMVLDTKTPADGTPEIIVGDTNRTATPAGEEYICRIAGAC